LKVLIIRFSSIGDIVLSTPVLHSLKNQGNHEIHYALKASFRDVLLHNPYIDKLHYLENSLPDLIRRLKKEKFDLIIDLHKNIRSFRVKNLLQKKSCTFDKLNWEKWLLVNFRINKLPDIHIVDRYFKPLEKIGIVNDGLGLDYFITEKDKEEARKIYSAFSVDYIAFSIGGNHNTKKYPSEKIVETIEKTAIPVILLGGVEEYERGEQIIRDSSYPHILNVCGKVALNVSAAIIGDAFCVISNDTGLMHIAAAFKKRIVSIWGNTIPGFGMYPYFGDNELYRNYSFISEVKGLRCRPCSKLGYRSCPKSHFDCMMQSDTGAIVAWIKNGSTENKGT
jgi:ADP-heptose:LPS heptosyltransferase